MNAGLANLSTLKAWLLPSGLVEGTDYDAQILAIGKGVAGQLERHCNRFFPRAVDDTFEISADRWHVVLPRFPVDATPAIELRDNLTTGYAAQTYTDLVIDHDLAAGLIKFSGMPGAPDSRLRFTYTGGYFFEPLEPVDVGYPTAAPDGSTAVPEDVLLSWRLMCESIWKTHDKLGLAIAEKPGSGGGALLGLSLPGLDLPPEVERLLQPFKRYLLT